MNPSVSLFQSMRAPGRPTPILQVLTMIQAGSWQAQIAQIRQERDPKVATSLKRSLPGFTASAITNGKRKAVDVIAHTGLLQGDVDKIGMERAESLRDAMRSDPCVFAAWISPSGDGLKLLIRISADIASHAQNFAAAEKHFLKRWDVTLDPACRDLSRLCFVSHDSRMWINQEAAEIPIVGDYEVGETPIHSQQIISTSTDSSSTPSSTSTQQEDRREKMGTGLPQKLILLYHRLCARRLSDVEPGTRNEWLCELVPLWFFALSKRIALQFAEAFWRDHEEVFNDSLEAHRKEASALYDGLQRGYSSGLSEVRKCALASLDPDLVDSFRICSSLAGVDPKLPPDQFYLSGDQLATRLGFVGMKGYRLLGQLMAKKIIEIVTKGTRHAKGERGTATVYRFLLP